jgi:vacuolar-type H+-ATPase subunit I/STV1
MNPRTLKSVYNKINKQELKSEKIELAAIDDARKIISNLGNSERILNDVEIASKEVVKEYVNLKVRIEKVKNSAKTVIGAETDIRKISDLIKRGDDVLRKIASQAKELGISVNSINEFDELFDFTQSLSSKINESEKYIRDVKDINSQI